MAILKENWFLEPVFDFEYKSYQVLGYTQLLEKYFVNRKFYPHLETLMRNIAEISAYSEARANLEKSLEREIERIDIRNKKLIKSPVEDKNGIIAELQGIIEFANKHFNKCFDHANAELAAAIKDVEITQLGINQSSAHHGLLFFRKPNKIRVYSYSLRMIMRPGRDGYKDVKTEYLKELTTGMFTNFNDVKWNVIRDGGMNLGTNSYLIETNTELPHFEMLLPVVKNYLIGCARD